MLSVIEMDGEKFVVRGVCYDIGYNEDDIDMLKQKYHGYEVLKNNNQLFFVNKIPEISFEKVV